MSDLQKQLNHSSSVLIKKATLREHRSQRDLFKNASIISIYGFQVSIPVLLGVLLGNFLDRIYPHPFLSWKLNFIILGFFIGLIDANIWLKKSFRIKKRKK